MTARGPSVMTSFGLNPLMNHATVATTLTRKLSGLNSRRMSHKAEILNMHDPCAVRLVHLLQTVEGEEGVNSVYNNILHFLPTATGINQSFISGK